MTLIQRMRELCSPLTPIPSGYKENLRQLSGIRAVLFDIYGTLFVSGSGDIGTSSPMDKGEALKEALENNGFSFNRKRAWTLVSELLVEKIRAFHAEQKKTGIIYPEIEIREILKQILITLIRKEEIEGNIYPGVIEKIALEYECRVNPTWPMPDAEETIEELKRKNLVLGIVSNAQFYTPYLFKAFLGHSHQELGFCDTACVWSYKVLEAKPSTALFQQALEPLRCRFGIKPQEVLCVGNDKLNDIWPAFRTGCKTALFAGDTRSLRLREEDERCKNLIPDVILLRLCQISKVLS